MIDRSFIEKIEELSKVEILDVCGLPYSTKKLSLVDDPTPDALCISTLTGIVDYVQLNGLEDDAHFIHVGPASAKVIDVKQTKFGGWKIRLIAEVIQNKFSFGNFYDVEAFNIALQAHFVQNDATRSILAVVGNLSDGLVRSFNDDGITQEVTAKVGITRKENMAVPNPVTLHPYRTFLEVEQPASQFVFRMRSGDKSPSCALFEADGGLWKNEAIQNIKAWLRERLPSMAIIA